MIGMSRSSGRAISGTDHLRQSVHDIISTLIGTRLCRRDYGSLVPELIDQPMNPATRLRLMNTMASAISRWEPRVQVRQIQIAPGDRAAHWLAHIDVTETRTGQALGLAIPLGAAT